MESSVMEFAYKNWNCFNSEVSDKTHTLTSISDCQPEMCWGCIQNEKRPRDCWTTDMCSFVLMPHKVYQDRTDIHISAHLSLSNVLKPTEYFTFYNPRSGALLFCLAGFCLGTSTDSTQEEFLLVNRLVKQLVEPSIFSDLLCAE